MRAAWWGLQFSALLIPVEINLAARSGVAAGLGPLSAMSPHNYRMYMELCRKWPTVPAAGLFTIPMALMERFARALRTDPRITRWPTILKIKIGMANFARFR